MVDDVRHIAAGPAGVPPANLVAGSRRPSTLEIWIVLQKQPRGPVVCGPTNLDDMEGVTMKMDWVARARHTSG